MQLFSEIQLTNVSIYLRTELNLNLLHIYIYIYMYVIHNIRSVFANSQQTVWPGPIVKWVFSHIFFSIPIFYHEQYSQLHLWKFCEICFLYIMSTFLCYQSFLPQPSGGSKIHTEIHFLIRIFSLRLFFHKHHENVDYEFF